MPDFNELVKNLYTSKGRELTPDKLDYINKTYKGKEEDFVKNFYTTIGEDLDSSKLDYIKSTYLTQPEKKNPVGTSLDESGATKATAGLSAISEPKNNPFGNNPIAGKLPDGSGLKIAPAVSGVAKKSKVKSQKSKAGKEDDYSFLDYASDNLGVGVDYLAKSAVELPEMGYDLLRQKNVTDAIDRFSPMGKIGTGARKALEFLDPTKDKKATAEDIKKFYGIRNVPAEHLKERISGLNKNIDAYNQKNGGDALTAIQNKQWGNAAKMIAGTTIQSLPIMGAAIMSGGSTAGNAAIGLSTASQKYADLKDEHPELSTEKKLGNAAVSGLLEATIGTFIEGASGQAMKRILAEKGTEEGAKIIGKGFKDMFAKAVEKNPAIGALGEVIEESTVEFGNQLNDINSGTRSELNLHEIANAGLSAMGMGAATTVPVYGAKAYMKAKDYQTVKNVNKEISKLSTQLNQEGVSEESKALITDKINTLVTENKKLLGTELEKVKALPAETKKELVKANNEIEELKSKAEAVKEDDSLTDDVKQSLLSDLKSKATEAVKKRSEILSINSNMEVNNDFTSFGGVLHDYNIEGENLPEVTEPAVVNTTAPTGAENSQVENETLETPNTTEIAPTQGENITANGSPESGANVLGESGASTGSATENSSSTDENNPVAENLGEEIVQPAGDGGTAESKVQQGGDRKIKLTEKGQSFVVAKKGDKLVVRKEDGSPVSRPTHRQVLRKYADNVDFTLGELAIDRSDFSGDMDAYEREVAEKSSNPAEVAEAAIYAESFADSKPAEHTVDHKQAIIADGIDKIKESGFNNADDRNNASKSIKKNYFDEKGRDIDDLAQELSERAGVEITTKDIADFIKEHPKGVKEFEQKSKNAVSEEQAKANEGINALKEAFTKMTGLPATSEYLKRAVEQKNRKSELSSPLYEMTDDELQSKLNELEQFENEQHGKAKTESAPKGSDDSKDNSDSGKKPAGESKADGKNSKQGRKKAVDASIDEMAAFLKSKLAIPHTAESNKNGISQEALIDFIADSAKALAHTGIDIHEAVKQVMDTLSEQFDLGVSQEEVVEKHFGEEKPKEKPAKKEEAPKEKTKPKPEPKKESPKNEKPELSDTNVGQSEGGKQKAEAKEDDKPEKTPLSARMADIKTTGISGIYNSKETISEADSEEGFTTNQEYKIMDLTEEFEHGKELVEAAKKEYGEDYVDKMIELIDKIKNHDAKVLNAISLESDLRVQRKNASTLEEKQRLTDEINKIQPITQKLGNTSSRALNLNRLRYFAMNGVFKNDRTEEFYSEDEKKTRKEIEKSLKSSTEYIQKAYEENESDVEDFFNEEDYIVEDFDLEVPEKKREKSAVKQELSDTIKQMRKALLDVAKGGGGTLSSIPYAQQVVTATPYVLKISKLLAEMGIINGKKAVDYIHNELKGVFPDVNKKDIAVMIQGESAKNTTLTEEEKYQKKLNQKIKQTEKAIADHGKKKPMVAGANSVWSNKLSELKAELSNLRNEKKDERARVRELKNKATESLINAGYGREITVTRTVTDENGKKSKVKEGKKVLDWKKLLGEHGSVTNMKNTVVETLMEGGVSKQEAESMADEMETSLNEIKQKVTEKSLSELQQRNKISKSVDVASESKKLSQSYQQGIFDEDMDKYNLALNKILGFDKYREKQYEELKKSSEQLAHLFEAKDVFNGKSTMSEESLKSQISHINKNINEIINKSAISHGGIKTKIMSMVRDYSDMALLSKLLSMKQMIENPVSGFIETAYQDIGSVMDKTKLPKELRSQINKGAANVFKDISFSGAPDLGDSSFSEIRGRKLEGAIRKINTKEGTDADKAKHAVAGTLAGTVYLNGMDSYFKYKATEITFYKAMIDALSNPKNGKGNTMSREEAIKKVSEAVTGENFEKAVKKAESLITEVNDKAGKTVLPYTEANINRFAMDIVKDNLVNNNLVDKETMKQIFSGSFKAAGSSFGHESNNPLSEAYKNSSSWLDKKTKDAIKNKDYDAFSKYVTMTILKNTFAPFMSGRFNWVVLAMQKSNLDLGMSMMNTARKASKNQIDFSSEEGRKNLAEAIHWKYRHERTVKRSLVGMGMTTLAVASLLASGKDDELEEMIEKSPTLKRFFKWLAPPVLNLYFAHNKEGAYGAVQNILDFYSITGNEDRGGFGDAIMKIANEKSKKKTQDKAVGELGKQTGKFFDTPLPWRLGKDVGNVVSELKGEEQYNPNYNATSFLSGLFQGGMFENIGLREILSGHEEKVKKKKKPSKFN